MRLDLEDRKKPTAAPCLSCRVTVNDHFTLSWRSKCPSSDVNVAGPLKHILLNIRSVGKGFPPPSRSGTRESQLYVSIMNLSKY